MRPDPIVEEIRLYREAKALEYGYDANVAHKDFVRLHEELMKVRTCEPAQRARPTVRRRGKVASLA
jgi:hypothetical protein